MHARALALIVLAINFLDVTTSLIPSPADHAIPVPERSTLAWVVQLALVAPLLMWTVRHLPAFVRSIRSLPIPRPALIVLGLFVFIDLAHIALRLEQFPFSPVAMFSSLMPRAADDDFVTDGYVVLHPDGVEHVSFLREGSPLFARHAFDWDYRAGWTMHMYATTHSTARAVVREQMASESLPPPIRARIAYSRSTGRLLWWRPLEP
jgi:hypothetical protein